MVRCVSSGERKPLLRDSDFGYNKLESAISASPFQTLMVRAAAGVTSTSVARFIYTTFRGENKRGTELHWSKPKRSIQRFPSSRRRVSFPALSHLRRVFLTTL